MGFLPSNALRSKSWFGRWNGYKILFTIVILLLSLNLEIALNLEKANPVNKAFLTLTVIAIALRGRVDKTRVVAIAIMYFGTFVAALFTYFKGFSWELYFRGSVSFIVAFAFLAVIPRRDDRDFTLKMLAWFPLISTIVGIFYDFAHIHPLFSMDDLGSMRFSGSSIPAYQAAASAVGAFAAMRYSDISRKRSYMILFALNMVQLLLTAGRMASLAAIISCAAAYIWGFRNRGQEKIIFGIIGSLGGLLAGGALFAELAKRMASNSLQGRDLIKAYLAPFISSNPWFGIGLGHQESIVTVAAGNAALSYVMASHDEYLRLRLECGWIGLFLISLGVVILFWSILQSAQIRRSPIFLAGLTAFLFYCYTDNAISQPSIFFLLIVATYGAGCTLEDLEPNHIPQRAGRQSPARPFNWQPIKTRRPKRWAQ